MGHPQLQQRRFESRSGSLGLKCPVRYKNMEETGHKLIYGLLNPTALAILAGEKWRKDVQNYTIIKKF